MTEQLIDFGLNGCKLQKDFYRQESCSGMGGHFGMTLSVGSSEKAFDDDDLWAINRKMEEIANILRGRVYNSKPETAEAAAKERIDLLACFGDHPIYVKEIPNGYCSDACHEKFPWFIVTTRRGPITIGWRKRVIYIDWEASDISVDGNELFKAEGITTGRQMVHAYGYEKASEYIRSLMAA